MMLKLFPRKYRTEVTDRLSIYRFAENGVSVKLAVTRRRANRRDLVHCTEGVVVREHLHPVGISPAREENVICRPAELMEGAMLSVLVIKGRPGCIIGLDSGIYASVRTVSSAPDRKKLYVMSEKAFRRLMKDHRYEKNGH